MLANPPRDTLMYVNSHAIPPEGNGGADDCAERDEERVVQSPAPREKIG